MENPQRSTKTEVKVKTESNGSTTETLVLQTNEQIRVEQTNAAPNGIFRTEISIILDPNPNLNQQIRRN